VAEVLEDIMLEARETLDRLAGVDAAEPLRERA